MKIEHLLIAIVIIFSSCSIDNPLKEKFEKNLPTSDLVVLEKWEQFYRDFLKENYNETSYEVGTKKFLKHIYDYEKTPLKYSEEDICRLREDYENSTLYYKFKHLEYDTVYEAIEGSGVIVTIKKDGEMEHFETFFNKDVRVIEQGKTTQVFIGDSLILQTEKEYFPDIMLLPEMTMEGKIKRIKDRRYTVFVHESSFVNSLRNLCEQSINAEEYVYVIDRSGSFQLDRICKYLLHDEEVDFDDYVVRKIIILEVVITYFAMINKY